MTREPGFYWAWDEEGRPQPVEVIGNGKVLVCGTDGPLSEDHFVAMDDMPVLQPGLPTDAQIIGAMAEVAAELGEPCTDELLLKLGRGFLRRARAELSR